MAGLAATVERMPRRLKADCKAGRAADMRTFGFLTMQIWAGFSFVCTTRCPDVTFAHPLSSVPVAASTVRPAMILMVLSSKSMLAVKRIFLKKKHCCQMCRGLTASEKKFLRCIKFCECLSMQNLRRQQQAPAEQRLNGHKQLNKVM